MNINDTIDRTTALVTAWLGEEGPVVWAQNQTNTALRDHAATCSATALLSHAGLPTHPDQPKNWDTFLALFHTMITVGPDEAILDAGAERYSVFLPALAKLGYRDLTAINLTFGASQKVNGITLQHGDITDTGFADRSYAFISSLSVLEHGVDTQAFLREAARLLRPCGRLFMSFDYWDEPVETHGLQAYGVPIRILTRQDVDEMLDCAAKHQLFIEGASDFHCEDRVVHWQRFDLRYTFANLLLRKGSSRSAT